MTTTTSTRTGACALYCRLSKRPNDDKLMTVAEQEKLLHVQVAPHGVGVVGSYADNGITGFKRAKRPGLDKLLAAIRGGDLTHVAILAVDRASRRMADVVAIVEACADANAMLIVDGKLMHPVDDAVVIYFHGMVGEQESREKSKRVLRAKTLSLANGSYSGGRRPFGFRKMENAAPGYWVQDPIEAKAIRDGYKLVLGGAPLIEVAQLWNARGIKTTTAGNAWSFAHVRRAMLSPIVCGRRTSNGEDAGALKLPDGELWPAILTYDEHKQLARTLTARYNATGKWHTPKPALLSGLLVCGLCKHRLTVRRYKGGTRPMSYACAADGGDRCGGVSIIGHRVEEFIVTGLVDLAESSPKFRKALVAPARQHAKGRPDLRKLQADLNTYTEAAERHEIEPSEYVRLTQPIRAKIKAAQTYDDDVDTVAILNEFADSPRTWWEAADLERQRMLLAALLLEPIEIAPAMSNQWDASRIGKPKFKF